MYIFLSFGSRGLSDKLHMICLSFPLLLVLESAIRVIRKHMFP